MVPLPPPGFPKIRAKWHSSSGAATDMDDMKFRSGVTEAYRFKPALENAIILEHVPLDLTKTDCMLMNE